ncbi:MAG: hypothetical protein AAB433_02385 [Nitrospirota bacterium]|jgi:hypothetical protein
MITPASLTLTVVEQAPSTLEDGLEELKAIADHTKSGATLDQLPLLVKRTLFLKAHLESGILAIEQDIERLTAEQSPTQTRSDKSPESPVTQSA